MDAWWRKSADRHADQGIGRAAFRSRHFFWRRDAAEFSARSAVPWITRKPSAARLARRVEFSLTTNATLLNEEIVDFLAEHRIGVTVSIDGDRELNDKMRIFHDGRGSYDVIVPKIKMLLQRHRTNSIGARVTLSSAYSHVRRIYEHLTQKWDLMRSAFRRPRPIRNASIPSGTKR